MINQVENLDIFIWWLYWFDKFWLFLPNIKFEGAWVLVLFNMIDGLFWSCVYYYRLFSLTSREILICRPPILKPNNLICHMIIGYLSHFKQELATDSFIVIMLVADHLMTTSLIQRWMILQYHISRILTIGFIVQKI